MLLIALSVMEPPFIFYDSSYFANSRWEDMGTDWGDNDVANGAYLKFPTTPPYWGLVKLDCRGLTCKSCE